MRLERRASAAQTRKNRRGQAVNTTDPKHLILPGSGIPGPKFHRSDSFCSVWFVLDSVGPLLHLAEKRWVGNMERYSTRMVAEGMAHLASSGR